MIRKDKRDPLNCPFCQAEERGCSEGWGLSPEGWEWMAIIHREGHNPPLECLEPLEIDCSASGSCISYWI